jgi:hypothetical protein
VKNMNMKYKLSGAIASGILMFSVMAPNAFAVTVDGSVLVIAGNGANSTNNITAVSSSTCDVTQKANTNVLSEVGVVGKTGDNSANNNTGGTTSIQSGDVTLSATVNVSGGSNTATDPCCCKAPAGSSYSGVVGVIYGNGKNSTNNVTEISTKSSAITQKAKTSIAAVVGTKAKTGKNTANGNVGSGTSIVSGNVSATAGLNVTGGINKLP